MDQLVAIVNGPNFKTFSIVFLILAFATFIFVRSGILTIHTKYVSMGIADKERTILRNQMIHAYQSCMGFLPSIPRLEGFTEERAQNICEKIYDEMVNWIVLNHITDEESYISIRQESVWNIILMNIINLDYNNAKFKEAIYKNVENDIKMFVKIRKNVER